MGRRSNRQSKKQFQLCRESKKYTLDEASNKTHYVDKNGKDKFGLSASRIFRIENGATPSPKEVLLMSRIYEKPQLCNYYCSQECEIGKEYIPEVQEMSLEQITLGILSSINSIQKEKDRLVEITEDGEIAREESLDFKRIQDSLEKISAIVESLQLWLEQNKSKKTNNLEH